MTAYVKARKQALKAGTWAPAVDPPVDLNQVPPHLAACLPPDLRAAYHQYLRSGDAVTMLGYLLRFGVEVVKARGYVR